MDPLSTDSESQVDTDRQTEKINGIKREASGQKNYNAARGLWI